MNEQDKSLVELVEDQVRNTESGNMERPQKRKEVTNTDVGNIERAPIRKDVLNTDFGNTVRAPIGRTSQVVILEAGRDHR
ncbi:uncharacterized protein Pyn_36508 [Prunus yedoensis var. nudiflora]|uniref:Uncharacterized protein n=1 Tax=Prunus yedoensis var. nudiflora TaxID=2094558 RepID=A0A314ZLW1_PRUYE|nr:uncharacterized protein Pyn_36508 [Prunus yedoensis var. nudiflora]